MVRGDGGQPRLWFICACRSRAQIRAAACGSAAASGERIPERVGIGCAAVDHVAERDSFAVSNERFPECISVG